MQFEVGTITEGKITGITNFGAFVQLENNITGLVHISEVASTYVKDINDHIKEGDVVKVKVLTIDERGKISLSIKKALETEQKRTAAPTAQQQTKKVASQEITFEDKMKMFMQDSNQKMHDLKRNFESKRGSGTYKKH